MHSRLNSSKIRQINLFKAKNNRVFNFTINKMNNLMQNRDKA